MAATKHLVLITTLLITTGVVQSIKIDLAHSTDRERQTRTQLEHVIASYDLRRYTFTHDVVIEEGAVNHAFPVLTLNARFADSGDELLSSYLHEQLHWYLREHSAQQQQAIGELRSRYPGAPVGLPEGAETAYSTYGHLVDCYLEIQADRRLIGRERTAAVISKKPHYTWIYKTILRDEASIGALVAKYHLSID